MKRNQIHLFLITLIVWATCVATASATSQDGERLVWNGKSYEMLTCPLYKNRGMEGRMKKWEQEWESTTALWRGFVGNWSIENGMLYLDYIATDKGGIVYPKDIPELRKYCKNGKVAATWFSDTLRVVSGNRIFYQPSGWTRYYEHEDFIVVKQGKVMSVERMENKVLIKGMVNNGRDREFAEYLKQLGADLHKRYPETSGRIVFQAKYTSFDSNYKPTAVEIIFLKNEPSNLQIDCELKEKLSQHILTAGVIPLYLINGKPTQLITWTIPISIH